MKIVSINLNGDPAAVGEYLVRAIRKYTEHDARHILYPHYFNLISGWHDLIVPENCAGNAEIAEAIISADVLHFNNCCWTDKRFAPYRQFVNRGQRVIFHGHGGSWLLDPTSTLKRCRDIGAAMATCSPMDEAAIGVGVATWIPNILPIGEMCKPDWNRNFNGSLIVGLSANHTNGVYKGATMVEYMVDYLRNEHGYDVGFELITGMSHIESIRARRNHHFTVDNWVQGFHGMAGFEGLALGHVVFSRHDELTRQKWEMFCDEMIPMVDVKGFDTCAKQIRKYHNDRDLLIEKSKQGRAWIEKYYNEKAILEKWLNFYETVRPIQ